MIGGARRGGGTGGMSSVQTGQDWNPQVRRLDMIRVATPTPQTVTVFDCNIPLRNSTDQDETTEDGQTGIGWQVQRK